MDLMLFPDKKHPDDVVDYALDLTQWLATGDAIASATVTVPAGITLDSDSISGNEVVFWLSGGTGGETYDITIAVVTDDAREATFDVRVTVEDPTP